MDGDGWKGLMEVLSPAREWSQNVEWSEDDRQGNGSEKAGAGGKIEINWRCKARERREKGQSLLPIFLFFFAMRLASVPTAQPFLA